MNRAPTRLHSRGTSAEEAQPVDGSAEVASSWSVPEDALWFLADSEDRDRRERHWGAGVTERLEGD